jgi:signal transduction histidine kinase
MHDRLREDWLTFLRTKGIYDQIRWLDSSGQERIRVNFNTGIPSGVPQDKLQNKGKRYYFTDTVKLNRGEIFISPLDLNIERGKIEEPIKPMIRIGTPVFDREGKKQGIVLLNYFGARMLGEFSQVMGAANSRAWLLNRDGYWLKGPSADLEWGGMYQRPEMSMVHRYPEAWKRVLPTEQGQFEDEYGLWTFGTVYPLVEGQKTSTGTHEAFVPSRSELESSGYYWKAVLLLPRKTYHATIWQTGLKLSAMTAVLLALLFIGARRLAAAHENLEERVEERTAELNEEIAERKHLEKQLVRAQRMEAIGQLTGGVAHDFNNLMAIMIGNAEMLKDGVGEDEEAKEYIEEIIAAIDQGSSLTGRLLAFSRKTTLSPVTTGVSELIGGLHDMLQRTLGETVELKVEGPPDLWPATIDPHQFELALVNLAINAKDAMPRGGTMTIETANVTLDKTFAEQHEEVIPGDYVEVAVSDTGTGMPHEVLEKVFEPFFTTKEVGEGSGLGLSMVYGFAKQSKGQITVNSEVDHGTTIKLYMPRSQEEAGESDTKDDTQEYARGSERILVVEDDPNVRKGPVKILRDQGYEVVEAGNGEEAINHLKTGQSFDLLFTDVVLPGGMTGVEIAEEAKRRQPGIKVLYATGYAENAVVHNGHLDPGVILVNKPYRRAELLGKVRAVLDSEDT